MKKEILYDILAIICGAWFLLFGIFWTYWMSLVIAYPMGALGFYFWYHSRKMQKSLLLNSIAFVILVTGLVCSLGSLFYYK